MLFRSDQKELEQFLRSGAVSEIIMIVSLQAPPGSSAPAPFSFSVERQNQGPKPPKQKQKR